MSATARLSSQLDRGEDFERQVDSIPIVGRSEGTRNEDCIKMKRDSFVMPWQSQIACGYDRDLKPRNEAQRVCRKQGLNSVAASMGS